MAPGKRAVSIALPAVLIAAAAFVSAQVVPRGAKRAFPSAASSHLQRSVSMPAAQAAGTIGVAIRSNTNAFFLLDAASNSITGPYFVTAAVRLYDVAVTSDGRTAVMTSDQGLAFVDISDPSAPRELGLASGATTGQRFLALTPDDKFAVVSNGTIGGFSKEWATGIATFLVAERVFAYRGHLQVSDTPPLAPFAGGLDRTILSNGSVFLLDRASGKPSLASAFFDRYAHLSGSPDGRTVILRGSATDRINVFRIDGPGVLFRPGEVQVPGADLGDPLGAFAPDGTLAFVLSGSHFENLPPGPSSLRVLAIHGPGLVSDSGISIAISPPRVVSAGSYGIRQIGVEPGGRYVYVGDGESYPQSANPIAVIDLQTGTQVKTLDAGPGPTAIAFPARPIRADIGLSVSVDRAWIPFDEEAVFSVTASNAGPSFTTDIEVLDSLPEGLAFVSASASQGDYSPGTGVWSIPVLETGESAVLGLKARAIRAGTWTNSASRRISRGVDPEPGNDLASATIVVGPPPDFSDAADNRLESDVLSARSGQIVALTTRYHNAGGPAAGLRIECPMDPGLDSVAPLDGGGQAGDRLVWDVGPVGTDAGGRVRFTARVKPGTPPGVKIFVAATIKPAGIPPIATNTIAITVVR